MINIELNYLELLVLNSNTWNHSTLSEISLILNKINYIFRTIVLIFVTMFITTFQPLYASAFFR